MRHWKLFVVLVVMIAVGLGCGSKQPERAAEIVSKDVGDARDRIDKHIEDDELKAHLLLLTEENTLCLMKIQQAYLVLQDEIETHPEMTKEEFEPLYAAFSKKRRAALDALASVQMETRGLVTPEQWKLIFPDPKKKKGDK